VPLRRIVAAGPIPLLPRTALITRCLWRIWFAEGGGENCTVLCSLLFPLMRANAVLVPLTLLGCQLHAPLRELLLEFEPLQSAYNETTRPRCVVELEKTEPSVLGDIV